jgi:outer membrane protein assembly factor BamA
MPQFRVSTSFRNAFCLLISSYLAAGEPPVPIESVSIHGTRLPVKFETQVGQAYDIHIIDRDVRSLWNTGRFDDIVVK